MEQKHAKKQAPKGRNFCIHLKVSPKKISEGQLLADSPNNNNLQIQKEDSEQIQQAIWGKLGRIFYSKEEEEDCLVALSLVELKKVIITIKRQKSPNTVANRIGNAFGQKSAKEIFLLNPKTGQVQVNLERGRQNIEDFKFVYPKDYYEKRNQDYSQRQEKKKAHKRWQQEAYNNSQNWAIKDENYEQDAQGDSSFDRNLQQMGRTQLIDFIKKNQKEGMKSSQKNIFFQEPQSQVINDPHIININQSNPQQQEYQYQKSENEQPVKINNKNSKREGSTQQKQQQGSQNQRLNDEEKEEEEENQSLNAEAFANFQQGGGGDDDDAQQEQHQKASSFVSQGIKGRRENHGIQARSKKIQKKPDDEKAKKQKLKLKKRKRDKGREAKDQRKALNISLRKADEKFIN